MTTVQVVLFFSLFTSACGFTGGISLVLYFWRLDRREAAKYVREALTAYGPSHDFPQLAKDLARVCELWERR